MEVFNRNQFPKPDESTPEYSVDVFVVSEDGLINIGYYHFEDEEWYFHTDTLHDMKDDNFKWCYAPKELFKN